MLVIMRGRVQAFVIQQRSYENLRRRSKHSTLSSSHGMPITNTWPSVSWRRGFGSNSSKSAPLRASAAASARLSASRKSSPQVTMNSGGRLTLNARPSAVRNFGSAASMPSIKILP